MAAIEAVCRELCRFSQDVLMEDEDANCRQEENYAIASKQLYVSEKDLSFYTNFLCIKNDAELKELLRLFEKLSDLTDGECGLIGELVDFSGSEPKILHFDVQEGEYIFELSAVEE